MAMPPLPKFMKAAVLSANSPSLQIETIPTPQPRAGEALVRVAACGVCHSDLHVMKGEVSFPRPAVMGHEISGTIVQFGAGVAAVDGLNIGDPVVGAFIMPCTTCPACLRGRDDMCANFFGQNRLKGTLYDGTSRLSMPDGSFLAMYSMGGLAEYAVVPVSALSVLDASVDLETSCILGCAGLTSYGAVFRAGQVEPGDAVAIVGSGGVGLSLIQMAQAAGATTIVAVDISEEKLDKARELGATHTVNALDHDPVESVREYTSGGANVAFEALGNPTTFRQTSRMLADGGRMVAIGIAAGAATGEIEITPLVRRGYTLVGSFGGRTRVDLPAVTRLVTSGDFDVSKLVTRRYALDDANAAYQALARGEITARAIITMPAASSH
ncbi:zinc-binding dehydrogenase [Mycetocola sp. 2940]|uniref:zinc-binding dehydrogenase n=1 Tax=Mycetocola sp. 2940 TaxID=3156452 RepID=UPI003394B055